MGSKCTGRLSGARSTGGTAARQLDHVCISPGKPPHRTLLFGKNNADNARGEPPGSQGVLPLSSPLRTGQESCPSSGSSPWPLSPVLLMPLPILKLGVPSIAAVVFWLPVQCWLQLNAPLAVFLNIEGTCLVAAAISFPPGLNRLKWFFESVNSGSTPGFSYPNFYLGLGSLTLGVIQGQSKDDQPHATQNWLGGARHRVYFKAV